MTFLLGTSLTSWVKRCILIFICLLSVFLWAVPVSLAQNVASDAVTSPTWESVPNRPGLDASAISSEKVSQFVNAYLQVVALLEQRESDLQAAETESESLQMQREVQAEAIELIKATGLTLQEYLQLLGLANIDPEFGERVAAQLQEAAA
ncbi:MAG: hypothetical protein Kow00121_18070 [Elainellaceae cyanobacterium]